MKLKNFPLNNDKPEPLTYLERQQILKTIKQMRGETKMKEFKDMTNEELAQMKIDIQDTLAYVEANKASYGANYEVAKTMTKALEMKCNKELAKRSK